GSAFEALVRRHGSMVLQVCRRVLRDNHAAEDAFQATFIVLAQKAATIGRSDLLGGWLHGVALRIALRARSQANRRRAREHRVDDIRGATGRIDSASGSDPNHGDLRVVIDEELSRLPEKYREPLILCYMEGRSNAEAACRLGWPSGTVKGRLSRARDLLRTRLA